MIKLLIGGSPCTHWSIAQKNNRETTAEGIGWETKQYRRFKRCLHRRLNSNKKVVQWARPKKGRKRANIGDYDCFENVWSNPNWEPKYKREDFEKGEEQ